MPVSGNENIAALIRSIFIPVQAQFFAGIQADQLFHVSFLVVDIHMSVIDPIVRNIPL